MQKHFVHFWEHISSKEHAKERAYIVLDEIKSYQPNARKILELGVGIGLVLEHFVDKFDVYGLDVEEKYIHVCKEKIPKGMFYVSSMHNFSINQEFEVIFSIYDSINFLESFDQWKSTFQQVFDHLTMNGIFVFDMYTLEILREEKIRKPSFEEFPLGFTVNRGKIVGNQLIWEFKVFEHIGNQLYELHEYVWKERIFPLKNVETELNLHFKILKKQPFEDGRRIRFVCQKK
ncbi:MAG: class I SAM-dependent methyltransferase [Candidatus Hermodarchaeota archaeon]